MPELAVLDQARAQLVTAGRVVKELQRHRAAGDAPQKAQVVGRRCGGLVGCDPEVDVVRVGRNLRVALDGTATFDRIANHLLAEPVERVAYHRCDHRMTRYEGKKPT